MNKNKKLQTSFYAHAEMMEQIKNEADFRLMSFSNYLILLHKLNMQKTKGDLRNE